MARLTTAIAAICLVAALALPSPAGAVTVGAPLDQPANVNQSCQGLVLFGTPPSCTLLGNDVSGGWTSQTPRGNWTITLARVRTGVVTGPMAFTVIRAMRSQVGASGLICCTVPVESQVFTPAPGAVNEIPVNLPVVNTVQVIGGEPVEVVDYLGISVLNLASALPLHQATSGADPAANAGLSYIIPAIRRGQEALQSGGLTGLMPLVNAEYAPAATTPVPPGAANLTGPSNSFSILPRVRLLPGGRRARLGVDLPGPGLLRAGAPGARAARASAKGKRPSLLAPAKRRVKKAGKAQITVGLSRAGKALLAKRGSLRVPVRVTFTPAGGKPASRTRGVTFRLPQAK